MVAIWCSAFTRIESSVDPEAKDQQSSLDLCMYFLDQVDQSTKLEHISNEINALVAISAANLCRLGLISHSLVNVRFQNQVHIAQIQIQTHAADDIAYMSPVLALNLNCAEGSKIRIEHITSQDIGVEENEWTKMQVLPCVAERVEISPVLWNSSSSANNQDQIVEALRSYFTIPKILQNGDIFGVPLAKAYPEVIVSPEGSEAPADTPPIYIQVDVCFFKVSAILAKEGQTPPRAHSVVKNETMLVQTTPISLRLLHERSLRQYILSALASPPPPIPQLSLFADQSAKLKQWLHPIALRLPISIILGGVAGSGKKTLLYNVAGQLGLYVMEVCFTELTTTSELQLLENIKQLVKKAQAMSPCILFFNRFFLSEKDNEEAELRLGATLMECMQRELQQIPLVVSVDDVNELPALVRQSFMYEIVLNAPSEEERLNVLRQLTATTALHPDVQLESLAHKTAGRTVGELKALIADASSHCLANLSNCDHVSYDDAMKYQLQNADFEHALQNQETKSSLGLGNFSIPNIKWEDVGGLEHAKDEILDMVQLPFKHPELFASGVRQRSGILLYGPPGTGKTLLAKAIATECNMNFISVKGPELLNMYIGESEKNVRQVFQMARNARPCILFFDELDSLAPMRGRGSDSGGVMDRVVSQLLTEIDSNLHQVFVVGATNRPDLIESALLRPGRFDRLIYLGICQDKATQLKVVQALTRKFHLAPSVDLKEVVNLCPLNFTGADFYALCSIALSLAIKDRVAALDLYIESVNKEDVYSERPLHAAMVLEKMSEEELQVQVQQGHFTAALPQVIPSVSASELVHYEKLRRQFSTQQSKK